MASARKPSQFSTPQMVSRKWSRTLPIAKPRLTGRKLTQATSTPVSPGAGSPAAPLMRANTLLAFKRGEGKGSVSIPELARIPSKHFVRIPQQISDSPVKRKGHVRSLTDSIPHPLSQSRSMNILPGSSHVPVVLDTVENVVMRCAFKTRTGTVAYRPKKHNQDAYLIVPNLAQCRGQYLFAVCDGHGTKGHEVSALIKDSLPESVCGSLPARSAVEDAKTRLSVGLHEGIKRVAANVYRSKIDATFSGSTCVATLISGRSLLCANVGDSRAILVRKDGKKWTFEALSTDHKPEIEEERLRIIRSGGRISPFRETNGMPIGPMRVWRGNDDIPGLAMTRSIGDLVACQAGVISEPELKFVTLGPSDKAIVIGSDGLWEFTKNQEVAETVGEYWESGNLEGTCEKLVRDAVGRWKHEDEVVDDITVIVVYLQVPSSSL